MEIGGMRDSTRRASRSWDFLGVTTMAAVGIMILGLAIPLNAAEVAAADEPPVPVEGIGPRARP